MVVVWPGILSLCTTCPRLQESHLPARLNFKFHICGCSLLSACIHGAPTAWGMLPRPPAKSKPYLNVNPDISSSPISPVLIDLSESEELKPTQQGKFIVKLQWRESWTGGERTGEELHLGPGDARTNATFSLTQWQWVLLISSLLCFLSVQSLPSFSPHPSSETAVQTLPTCLSRPGPLLARALLCFNPTLLLSVGHKPLDVGWP